MVYAMFIVLLLLLDIYTAPCLTTTTITTATTSNFTYNCSFLTSIYLTNAGVSNQFQFPNSTSITVLASYAFRFAPSLTSTFELGLIYPFSASASLVPFPVIFNCATVVRSCQLKTMAGTMPMSRYSEPIPVQLTQFNYTSPLIPLNQMGLYLRQGQYQLSNCLLDDGNSITEPQTIFNIQIQYEKSIGSSCNPSSDICGSSNLTTCSPSSPSVCSCLSTSSLVPYANTFYCADTMNSTNCTVFPTRCVTWCNATTNNLCNCPTDTRKTQENNLYFCELPMNSLNCSNTDTIKRCPSGQICINGQCASDITTLVTKTSTTKTTSIVDNSSDQPLRIALGIVAGLLGVSVIILVGAFLWLRRRRLRLKIQAQNSDSPSSSSTSSLYISPIQQQNLQQPTALSTNTLYQKPFDSNHRIFSPVYRTDSFRQAVLSGQRRFSGPIEHISTRRDSYIDRISPDKDDENSPVYSTLESIVTTRTRYSRDSNKIHNDIYSIPIPASSTPALAHIV